MEWMVISSRQRGEKKSPFHTAQNISTLALKAKMPSFNKKKRSEKIKAEKREKKSLQAVPPAVPEGCVHPMSKYSRLLGGYLVYGVWMPGHEGDVL